MAPEREDKTEEAANIRRLVEAGIRNQDPLTQAVVVRRASRLGKETGLDITDPTAAELLKLNQLPRVEEG